MGVLWCGCDVVGEVVGFAMLMWTWWGMRITMSLQEMDLYGTLVVKVHFSIDFLWSMFPQNSAPCTSTSYTLTTVYFLHSTYLAVSPIKLLLALRNGRALALCTQVVQYLCLESFQSQNRELHLKSQRGNNHF